MASQRYVVLLKSSGETNQATPIAYTRLADARTAAVAAAPAGGYRIVDSWKECYVEEQTTGVKLIADFSVNENSALNINGTASETWPI